MSEFGQNLKNIVMKSIETIGTTAGSIATNTRQKVEEFNLSNNLRDIYAEIGAKVFDLSKHGTEFPADLSELLLRAAETERGLTLMREQKEGTGTAETADRSVDAVQTSDIRENHEKPAAAEYTAENNHDIPVICVEEEEEDPAVPVNNPLSSAINDLFENLPPVDKMVDKVNSSLDDLGDSLRKFSGEFDKQLNDFADQMMGKNNQDH